MTTQSTELPYVRWGILGTGWMSGMFADDLLVPRPAAQAKHSIAAIGTSNLTKAQAFVDTRFTDGTAPKPLIYTDLHDFYNDPNIDVVYVGTPHTLHRQNCLDAITAGKNVLCEKPFAINAKDANEVIDAARKKGVYIMEGVWTRFLPVMASLQDHLHKRKSIGTIQRVFVDFSLQMNLSSLPSTSRLRDPALGAGALLDIGIYPLTIASVILGNGAVGDSHPTPRVTSSLAISDGIDHSNVVVLSYPQHTGPDSVAICTSTLQRQGSKDFCTIEGSEGTITVFGLAASIPQGFRIQRGANSPVVLEGCKLADEKFEFSHPGVGWNFEADAVAVDISLNRTENEAMPLAETLRILNLTDAIRKAGGLIYPQDR